jgi:hypothetical protein
MTEQYTSMKHLLRTLALSDPRKAFDAARTPYNLRDASTRHLPQVMDYEGDMCSAYSAKTSLMDEGYVTITEYPYGMETITFGSEELILVMRKRRGDDQGEFHYVYEEALERYRATGVIGDVEAHDPASFLDLLKEHGILEAEGIAAQNTWDPRYVEWLRENGAGSGVVDAD